MNSTQDKSAKQRPTVFISYSHKDEEWKDRLAPFLKAIANATDDDIVVWDDRKIDAGDKWYPEIRDALSRAAIAVCLVSEHFLASDFCVKEEVPYLLKRQEQDGILILYVLIRPCPWKSFRWIREHQMLPRDGETVELNFRGKKASVVFNDVAERIQKKLDDPGFLIPAPSPEWPALAVELVDVSRLPETGSDLFGRDEELNLLDEAWKGDSTNVVVFKAWGGVGKSTLVRNWTEQMGEDNYRGAQRVFAWSFYSQGTGDRVTSADLFISKALTFFGDDDPTAGGPWDKGERLARLVADQPSLLLLDGMEPLQSAQEFDHGRVTDPALQSLLTGLALKNPGLCVVSTREEVTDLQDPRFAAAVVHRDLEQVDPAAGRALLNIRGIRGTDRQLEQAVAAFGCHALAINLLASYLTETADGNIGAASTIPDIEVPVEKGKHPRRVITAWANYLGESPEVQILKILGLFDCPATDGELAAVSAEPTISGLTDLLPVGTTLLDTAAVKCLRDIGLVATESSHRPDILDAHPLIREHFAEAIQRLSDGETQSVRDSDVSPSLPSSVSPFHEAHRRLYEHLIQSAPELPDNLNDMMPLFHAVAHGIKAGSVTESLEELRRRLNRVGVSVFPATSSAEVWIDQSISPTQLAKLLLRLEQEFERVDLQISVSSVGTKEIGE